MRSAAQIKLDRLVRASSPGTVAKKVGSNPATIRLLIGGASPRANTIERLRVLGIDPLDWFAAEPAKPTKKATKKPASKKAEPAPKPEPTPLPPPAPPPQTPEDIERELQALGIAADDNGNNVVANPFAEAG